MSAKRIYEIDGENFSSLSGFYEEISRVLIPGKKWGKNLDAFNDILAGGFGTPDEGFVLVWKNSELSRKELRDSRVSKKKAVIRAFPLSFSKETWKKLDDAENGTEESMFEELVEIIRRHCKGGDCEEDGVELILQ